MTAYKYDIFKSFDHIEYWARKIIVEIRNLENITMCHCKKDILEEKWYVWTKWWYSYTTYILSKKIESGIRNKEFFIQTINSNMEEIDDRIKSRSNIPKKVYDMFNEIHSGIVEEFKIEMDRIRTIPNISKQEFIDKLGKLLTLLCVNSILEMKEMKIDCGANSCEWNNQTIKTLTLFINEAYDINGYIFKKLTSIHKLIQQQKRPHHIIMDFRFYDERPITEKILYGIEFAKKLFDKVDIINYQFDESDLSYKMSDEKIKEWEAYVKNYNK